MFALTDAGLSGSVKGGQVGQSQPSFSFLGQTVDQSVVNVLSTSHHTGQLRVFIVEP